MTQDEALKIMKMGTSVFLTGAPGSGKTYVLNKYLDFLYECGVRTAITASTGIAATHIGGSTIHSWSGIGIKKELREEDIDRLTQNERLYKRYQNTHVLVIDEVSMLGAGQFEMIDVLARKMRRRSEPFGGMQVVLSGDFFQLPPVVRGGEDARYAFESDSWRDLNPVACYLDKNYRHEEEDELKDVLTRIREQDNLEEIHRFLREQALSEKSDDQKDATRLYTHNIDVDALNESKLAELPGEKFVFEMQEKGSKKSVRSLKNWCLASEVLELKEGAQVMFVKNDPGGRFVNGTRGVVLGKKEGLPLVKTLSGEEMTVDRASWIMEEDGRVKAEVSQIPLRLAWAITVHKSQGMTLDEAHMDLSKSFAPGQGYVALSRVRGMGGLQLLGLNERALSVDPRALERDKRFKAHSKAASLRLGEVGSDEIDRKIKIFIKGIGGEVPKGEDVFDAKRKVSRDKRSPRKKVSTYDKTKKLILEKLSIAEIAEKRELKKSTIMSHFEKLKESAEADLTHHLEMFEKEIKDFRTALKAFEELMEFKLSPVKEHLEKKKGIEIDYDSLRLVRLALPEKVFKELKKESLKK